MVTVPQLKPGNYVIQVVPKPGASPTDTYGIDVIANGNVIPLAQNVLIRDIPSEGYGIRFTGGAITPFIPIASFTAKAEIELGKHANDAAFEVKANFTLGAGSNGIDPVHEDVTLELNGGMASFSTTIPAGSFKQDKNKHFKFEGTINGVKLEAKITPLGGNAFEFKIEGEHANLTGMANPVTVTLTIGNDSGDTQ